jgi:hypothetical protein
MLEAADPSTGEHSDDVELVVGEICKRLAVTGEEREDILVAARLHDVGKVAIPREVLTKNGPLDDDEWRLVKEHTVTGERILKSVPELVPASVLVRHSHEHFDGSGYPDGLAGEKIPLGSRIILCADAFHAIRSDRPYRKGRPTPAALAEMQRCAGTQFDPKVVEALHASVRRSKRGGRRKLPPRLAILFAVLAIGGGGAYAAERGWIPSPVPGLGPEHSGDSQAETEQASATAAGAASTAGDDTASATGEADGATSAAGGDAGTGRRGDSGAVSLNAVTGPNEGGKGQSGADAAGGGAPGTMGSGSGGGGGGGAEGSGGGSASAPGISNFS